MLSSLRAADGLLALVLLASCHEDKDETPATENLNVPLTPVATSSVL